MINQVLKNIGTFSAEELDLIQKVSERAGINLSKQSIGIVEIFL